MELFGPPNIPGLEAKQDIARLAKALGYRSKKYVSIHRDALAALRRIGGARVVEPILSAWRSDDPSLRLAAARALAELGAIEALVGVWNDAEADMCAAPATTTCTRTHWSRR